MQGPGLVLRIRWARQVKQDFGVEDTEPTNAWLNDLFQNWDVVLPVVLVASQIDGAS